MRVALGALLATLLLAQSTAAPPPVITGPIGAGGVQNAGPGMGITGGFWIAAAPPVACSGSLVLDYSNSCNLIAQAWGQ